MSNKKPVYYCNRRKRQCRNLDCQHQFTKEEHDLWECPDCGEDRHCRNRVREEGAACKKSHGGSSPKGMAGSNFKHGRYSKYLPTRYRQKYEEAMEDPDILELLPEIHLLDMRIKELFEQMGEDDPIGRLAQARDSFRELSAAMSAGNTDKLMISLDALDSILNKPNEPDVIWSKIQGLIAQIQRVKESQIKKEQKTDLNLNEGAMLLLSALESVIRLHVRDQDVINRMIADLEAIAFIGSGTGETSTLEFAD